MFDGIRNWFEVRAAMKDARKLRADRATLNTVIVEEKLRHIQEMIQVGQVDYASETMEQLLARYPAEVAELPDTISIMIDLNRLDEAERLAVRGMQRNPDFRQFQILHGVIANRRPDPPEALRRWRAFRRRYPAFGMAFQMEAGALLAAGEDSAAEQVLAEGVRVVPDDTGVAIDYAQRADARQDWPEALRRWTVVHEKFNHSMGVSRSAVALAEQGLFDQAEETLKAGRVRFPLEPGIVEALAALAERRGDIDGALTCWAELRRDLPQVMRAFTEAARLLHDRGDAAAADALIGEAAERAFTDRLVQYEYAAIPERTGEWGEASRRWMLVRQRFTSETMPVCREAAALRSLGLLDDAERLLMTGLGRFPDAADIHQQLAELAAARGDLKGSAERWRAAVAAAPDVWWTHTSLARALDRCGDRAAAEAALAAGIARLPDQADLYAEHAILAARDGRTEIAAARWTAARQRFGLLPVLARAEANELLGQQRRAEAKAMLAEASRQTPTNIDLLQDLGNLAVQAADWPEAERCWRAILALNPRINWVYDLLAQALREQQRGAEAEALLEAACQARPKDFHIAAAWARQAADAKDWPEAQRRWTLLRDRFPAEGHPWWQQGIALREAGQTEEARALFLAGAERFPKDTSFPHDLARLAEARGDWPDAEHWWRVLVGLNPALWWAYTGLAGALSAQDRGSEAEAALRAAYEALPGDVGILFDLASLAERRGDLAAAEDILRNGQERHPSVAAFQQHLARLAERRGDWAAVEQAWRRYLDIDPQPWGARNALARACIARGKRAEALAILRDNGSATEPVDPYALADTIQVLGTCLAPDVLAWIEHLGDHLAPHIATSSDAHLGMAHANAARYLERFEDYRTRMEALAVRFPREHFVRQALHVAYELAPRDEDLSAESQSKLLLGLTAAGEESSDAFRDEDLLRFESLGGGGSRGGCEFGLLQRRVGEPLTLLRWASIVPHKLIEGLECQFAGIGNPATLSIETQGHYDWKAVETRFEIYMDHTHLDRQTVSRETALRQVSTRMKFLARKLTSDLGEGDKIFLYRMAGEVLSDETLLQISNAVASYGNAAVLVVCEAASLRDAIEYRQVAPNLLLAVRPDTTSTDGLDLEPRLPGWRQMCEQALLWRKGLFSGPARLPYPGQTQDLPADASATGAERAVAASLSDDFATACGWARQAAEAKDWPEAQQRWAVLRERFPAEGHPWWQQAVALREAGQPQEAAALLLAGAERFPRDTSFPHDLARLAEGDGDWPQAERWWRAFLGLQPDQWWAHTGLANALAKQDRVAEAERVLLAAHESLPSAAPILLDHARLAEQRRDWAEAERRFGLVATRFPEAWEAAAGLAAIAREQGQIDVAEQHLRQGAERHPQIGSFAIDLARLAEARRDWPEAARWWRAFLRCEPQHWWAHSALANALLEQGCASEADTVLVDAHAAMPAVVDILIDYARLAERGGRWPAALDRWTQVVERSPGDPVSLRQLAFAHSQTGEPDRAAHLLLSGLERHPQDREFARDLLRLAIARRDNAAAAKWRGHLVAMLGAALEREPGEASLMTEFIGAMAEVPQAEWPMPASQVEQLLQGEIERGNRHDPLHAAYAEIAAGRGDWPEHLRRLETANLLFPDNHHLQVKLFAAREIMLGVNEDPVRVADRVVPVDVASPELPPEQLVLLFESLGGGGLHEDSWGYGCEFGYFQRAFGQEPLSLLRWASIGPQSLARALADEFAGFGKPEFTELNDNTGEDWGAIETVYGSRFDHTHLSRATVSRQEALRLVCMRMKFLARKLIGDLQAGEKIFVYRVIDRELDEAAILQLAAAVNRYGDNVLLFVALANDRHPALHVRRVHSGLMIGYIDHFRACDGRFLDDNRASWLRLCREALRVRQESSAAPRDAALDFA